jgi:hypothetical protein
MHLQPPRPDALLARLHTQLHEIRLDLQARWLRGRERAALRRLGQAAAGRVDERDGEDVRRLALALADGRRELDALAAESARSLEADRTDFGRVTAWMRPAVVARGVCTRAVLRHRSGATRRMLAPAYEALGSAVAGRAPERGPRDVAAARARLRQLAAERDVRLAAYGESAHPAWTRRAGVEAAGLGRSVLGQLRSALVPKLPAMAGMLMGWWIANTYTDSHLRSVLRSVGIGSGGTRVVSGSTYKAMNFWLPLLAAAVCAYACERLVGYYRQRGAGAQPAPGGEPV